MKILKSKLSIPEPVSYIINRRRLSEKILENKKARLFLLVAPAGYGKSTVAQQVLSTLSGLRKGWYYLESQDAEPRRFMLYLLEILSSAVTSLKSSRLREKLINDKAKPIEIAEDLCFLFQEYKGPSVWLVLDNWEAVDYQNDIKIIASTLISHTNNNLKLVFNSRVKPSFKFRKLQESGKALVLNKSELAFNFPEFIEAFERRVKNPIDEQELEKIWKITSGWCVNLGLILEMLHRRGSKKSSNILAEMKDSESLSDYLREELFQELPAEFLDFITKCSVLDIISPSSCKSLFQNDEIVKRNIKALDKSSIPLFALPEKDSYRLHPIIRQEANRLLRDRASSDELDGLYSMAAKYFVDNGAIMEALELLMDYKDYDSSLSLIEKEWYKIIDLNGLPQVEQWLKQFPEEMQMRPLYIRTMTNLLCIFGYNQDLVDFLGDRLNPDNFEKGDPILCNLWVRYNWAKLHTIDQPQYEAIKNDWESLNAQKGPFPESTLSGVELTLSCGAYNELRLELALEHNHNSLEFIGKDSETYRISVLDNDALFLHMLGRSFESIEILEKNIRMGDKIGVLNGRAHRLISIGWIYGSIGEYEKAIEKIDEGMETMYKYDLHNVRDHMYADRYAGQALWHLGEKEEAIRKLENSYKYAKNHNQKEAIVTGLLIEYYTMLDGRPRTIIDLSQIPDIGVISSTRLLYLTHRAYQSIMENDLEGAPLFIDELRSISDKCDLLPWRATSDLFYAYWADVSGKIDLSKKYLKSGLEILEKINWSSYQMSNNLLNVFIYIKSLRYGLYPSRAHKIAKNVNDYHLAKALINEISGGNCNEDELKNLFEAAIDSKIRGLVKLADDIKSNGNGPNQALAQKYLDVIKQESLPPLIVRTFGGFSIISNNEPVKFNRRNSKLLCQLLLIDYPKSIHEEVLIEHLWPESDPSKSRANLQTCAKDLRKALDPFYEPRGESYLKYDDHHYRLILPEESVIDFMEFMKSAGNNIKHIEITNLTVTQVKDFRNALKIYRGEFLPHERYEPYTLELREHLQKRYFEMVLIYADWLITNNQFGTAIELIENGLRFDQFWTEGVQKLMEARAKNGELFKALKVYKNYEKRLHDELGLPPDEDMKQYFDRLANN